MKFDFHPAAYKEFLEAVDFYEDCEPGLGEEFAVAIYDCLKNILCYPDAWPLMQEDIHRCLVHRFPFGVLYSIESDCIFVLAVMHLQRYPDYWKNKL